jgi:hypothetical protein
MSPLGLEITVNVLQSLYSLQLCVVIPTIKNEIIIKLKFLSYCYQKTLNLHQKQMNSVHCTYSPYAKIKEDQYAGVLVHFHSQGNLWLLFLSPHTGFQAYQDGVPKIPTACITVEDAEMMSRMASHGNTIVIQLKMGAKTFPDTDSFNTVAEITGSKYPEQVS